MLFEDDVFKIEIPLEEISGLESADKTNESADKRDKPPINFVLEEQERLIIDYINKHGSITNANACETLGIKPTRAKEIFRAKVDKNILSAIGDRKARKYVLKQAD